MSVEPTFSLEDLIGSALCGLSFVLTMHSLLRMTFLQRSPSKYHLFPIINIAQLANEIALLLLVFSDTYYLNSTWGLWLNVVNNASYFIVKPTILYLAYLRCRAVWPQYKKADIFHYGMIGLRAAELFVVLVINVTDTVMCNGLYVGTQCEPMNLIWQLRNGFAPVFRFYYIISEGIFYYKLFRGLNAITTERNSNVLCYSRLQSFLFGIDLITLTAMSIYRTIILVRTDLPSYLFAEMASTALTMFNLTEFGLTIRELFNYGRPQGLDSGGYGGGGTFSLPERNDLQLPSPTAIKSRQTLSVRPSSASPSRSSPNTNYNFHGDLKRASDDERAELTVQQELAFGLIVPDFESNKATGVSIETQKYH